MEHSKIMSVEFDILFDQWLEFVLILLCVNNRKVCKSLACIVRLATNCKTDEGIPRTSQFSLFDAVCLYSPLYLLLVMIGLSQIVAYLMLSVLLEAGIKFYMGTPCSIWGPSSYPRWCSFISFWRSFCQRGWFYLMDGKQYQETSAFPKQWPSLLDLS